MLGQGQQSSSPRRGVPRHAACAVLSSLVLLAAAAPAGASYQPGEPPNIDPGVPPFAGLDHPVPAEPAAYDPSKNMMRAIFDADARNGGDSYWFDRILERPFLSNGDSALFTRGRALYLYTHQPRTIGFGGGYAYRERPTGSSQNLYTVAVSGATPTEDTTKRVQYPSYFKTTFTDAGLSIGETKFITYNNVAVTNLTVTNTGDAATTRTLTVSSPVATTASADNRELTGTVTARYGLTTISARLSGSGFTTDGSTLTRTLTLDPGASATVKIVMGMITAELSRSASEYDRYRGYDPSTALRTQQREYNDYWVDNVPYVDIPNDNVKKISYYRTWENRFNSFDGNIPGNDYQFPVDLEGALGYNNQISLTVPMRMQDLKFWRDPLWSYGPWLSQGEESGCQAFHDNPGNTANWNNTYEQWTAREAWQSYLVHGGPPEVVRNLAKYAECDLKGTLAKFDTNNNGLIQYSSGTLPGNDADSVAFAFFGARPQDRTETSFWYSGAKAAAAEYRMLGQSAKASEMDGIAERIKTAILSNLWADGPIEGEPPGGGATGARVAGKVGNAVKLNGIGEYVNLPAGIVSGLSDFTISAWVNPAATTAWSRVFDFGTGTTANMFLTVSAGGAPPRFAITTAGGGNEQRLNAQSPLPTNTWSHLTVTLSGTTARLYVNGTLVDTNPNMTLHPSSLGATNQNWIGRSQYGDPLLNATVDDFQIYDHALSDAEVQALAGGAQGAGNVASYRFDEADGATATDSSGNGRDATIVEPTVTNSCPGQAFLQRDLTSGSFVCWKDQQNFAPFIDGIAPNSDTYKGALRYYADRNEFPIMPFYTANQADKQAATEFGRPGSNNFSNINATLQARLFSRAIRDYPSQYITPDMYRQLIEWLSWTQYINGDNRFPDNNEFFFNWNPATKTIGRSGIHHDVLGSFNWMVFEDIAGLHPRLDDTVELSPIDMGFDHFTVNSLSYHGSDVTIVWDKPGDGKRYYPKAPEGYSLYVDGERVMTVSDLAHVAWTPRNGHVAVLDGSATKVSFSAHGDLRTAAQVSLSRNDRMADAFQRAGVDLDSRAKNLAEGRPATASFTTTTPASQATDPANAVDGFTISGLPVVSGSYIGTNPIWGDVGSPNDSDWLEVDLGTPTKFDTVKLYFYSNKNFGSGGNTYREPASYTVQVLDGTDWVDVPGQDKTPATPMPNYNRVDIAGKRGVMARKLRVLMTRQPGYGVGLKEIQVFREG